MRRLRCTVLFAAVALAHGCGSTADQSPAREPQSPRRVVSTIIVAGERVPIEAPRVVTFADPGGYDARLKTCFFDSNRVLPRKPARGCDTPSRIGRRAVDDLPPATRAAIERDGWTRATLAERVTQFVVHYDVCATSHRCFEVLHDIRGLSVHFLLDVDGTLYQTCDLTARARHAGAANDRSVGIEIAHIGAYPPGDDSWRRFYAPRVGGSLELSLPDELRPPPGGPYLPSRPGLFRGVINGREVVQPDYTDSQYDTLAALLAALRESLPGIELRVPRAADGTVLAEALPPQELKEFRGVLGHYHVTRRKIDPGPAFDWDRILVDSVARESATAAPPPP